MMDMKCKYTCLGLIIVIVSVLGVCWNNKMYVQKGAFYFWLSYFSQFVMCNWVVTSGVVHSFKYYCKS